VQYGTAQNINELYDTVVPDVVLSLLVHKVIFLTASLMLFQFISFILLDFLLHCTTENFKEDCPSTWVVSFQVIKWDSKT
jgi:hypothetical protein